MDPERPSLSDIRNYSQASYKLVPELCNAKVKLGTARQQLTFNIRCKRNHVLPKSLRFRPPIRTLEAQNIAFNTGYKYLELFIKNNHYHIRQETFEINRLQNILLGSLPTHLYNFAIEISDNKLNQSANRKKEDLKRKYNNLINSNSGTNNFNEHWIKNISSKELTD